MTVVTAGARLGPEPVQLLSPADRAYTDVEQQLALAPEEYRRLFHDMAVSRAFDEDAFRLQRQGKLALWPPLLGQEAAQVGSAHALHSDDYAFPSYREHAVAYCRGLDLACLLRLYRGDTHGGWDPHGYHFHLYTVVLGAQALHAVGYAMGVQRENTDQAVIAYFGDGATSQGDTNEALVWASTMNAPLVFFCQNNQWAISTPVERQTPVPIAQRAAGFGIPSVRVDGNDVLACLAETRAALDRARSGQGPTLIEALTYRMGPHTTSDDPTRYRTAAELEHWRGRDPLARFRDFLTANALADETFFSAVASDASSIIAAAREHAIDQPDPPAENLFTHTYVEPHPALTNQRNAYLNYLASFDE
jgi:pyruvate dehydrogenase E1 component alpha subunit